MACSQPDAGRINQAHYLPFDDLREPGTLISEMLPASADAMSSVAVRSFGVSAFVIRPTSPYLKVLHWAERFETKMRILSSRQMSVVIVDVDVDCGIVTSFRQRQARCWSQVRPSR